MIAWKIAPAQSEKDILYANLNALTSIIT
eukprot:Gb_36385 [translate_table: standard]